MRVRGGSDFGADFDAVVDKITYVAVFVALLIGGGFDGWSELPQAGIWTCMVLSTGMAGVLQWRRIQKAQLMESDPEAKKFFHNRSNPFGKAKVWAEWGSFLLVCFTQIWGVADPFVWGAVATALIALDLAFGSLRAHNKGVETFLKSRPDT